MIERRKANDSFSPSSALSPSHRTLAAVSPKLETCQRNKGCTTIRYPPKVTKRAVEERADTNTRLEDIRSNETGT